MRRIFISADMEGCAAVSAPQALMPDRWAWEWNAARLWMTAEVVAVAEAALAADFQQVIVADAHGNAHNIDPNGLPDDVLLVRSWPRPLLQMQGVEDREVDVCAFVGYHAGPTTAGSIMAHAYSGAAIRSLRLNGEVCSEGYLNAALAGELGKPVVFVSGDQHVVEDAQRYAPEAVHFIAKRSLGWRSQISLPPVQVQREMKQAFAEALRRPKPKPFVLKAPYYLELEMVSQVAAEILAYLPNVERRGGYTVCSNFDRIDSVMKFVSLAIHYSPTGVFSF